ncbi:MAG: hypothetical protein AABY22_33165 [Nanoarchaeota archaeon]
MKINSKKKGNRFENLWANWLKDNEIKAWRDSYSGGGDREKSDVANNLNYNFEVKAVKKLSLQKAWRQSVKAAGVYNTPSVIVHFDGMAQDQFLVVIDNWTFLNLIKTQCKNPEIHQ